MYYFHFTKGMKINYLMEDSNKDLVYEARMQKLTFFKPYIYIFKNIKTNKSEEYKISHGITKSTGFGVGDNTRLSVVTDNHIKINGKNNWEYLKEMGCSFKTSMNGLKPCYTLYQNDKIIAHINTTGANVYDDEGALSKLPINGYYQVECEEKDIEIVFMFCFMMARACILGGE